MKLLILFLLLSIPASAQFYSAPFGDCCSQAIQLTKDKAALVDSLRRKTTLLDSTRAVGSRIIAATDERLSQALKSGNTAVSESARLTAAISQLGLQGWNPFFNKRRWARRVLGR